MQAVIAMLEGGNANMMRYVLHKQRRKRLMGSQKTAFLGGKGIISTEDLDKSFDIRYFKSKSLSSYRRFLANRVAEVMTSMAKGNDNDNDRNEVDQQTFPGATAIVRGQIGSESKKVYLTHRSEMSQNLSALSPQYEGARNPPDPYAKSGPAMMENDIDAPAFEVDDTGWQRNRDDFHEEVSYPSHNDHKTRSGQSFDTGSHCSYDTISHKGRGIQTQGHHRILRAQEKIRLKREQLLTGIETCNKALVYPLCTPSHAEPAIKYRPRQAWQLQERNLTRKVNLQPLWFNRLENLFR